MEFSTFKNIIFDICSKKDIADFELFYSSSDDTSVSAFGGEINDFSCGFTGGVCFRCIVNDRMGLAYTQDLSEASAANLVSRAYENAVSMETEEKEYFSKAGGEYEDYEPCVMELASPAELTELALKGLDALSVSDPSVTDKCSASTGATANEMYLVNSNGVDLSFKASLNYVVLESVVSDGNDTNDAYKMKVTSLDELDLDALAKEASEDAVAMLGAGVAPTASCPVVFSPGAFCSLLSTFSSSFSSENAAKGLSPLAGKEGEKVAGDLITLVDDPFYPENPLRINFDSEGSPARKKEVITNGTLNTLLYNLKTAAAAGKETTGNASRAGYKSAVSIRPFTMYLQPGEYTEDELLAMAGNGVYIDSVGGLHAGANQITADFSLMSSGFLIENGKKGAPVRSFTVAGNFFDMLKAVTAVGNNIKLPHPGSLTSYAAPSVLVKELSIAGK